ncbi:hypothetical protein JYU34_000098 [Plutella xylostella]|uniref:Uncharacterized protein n=1 Tax=Plutella xylostella TaxID=51655 RepID=A0ABQ7R6U2_PLUXY|nr:uncharacterized protein LOC125491227 [Plutella xylostella]KAG7313017.1 hypothetical protein JYU34_000098 [Plutella xylostella]
MSKDTQSSDNQTKLLRVSKSHGANSAESDRSFQIFRNNSTAIEVIVKAIPKALKRKTRNDETSRSGLSEGPGSMNNVRTAQTGGDLGALVLELKRQLDVTSRRELDAQADLVHLRFENEKLKTLLESKTNIVLKLRKELGNVRHTLKNIIKGICSRCQVADGPFSEPEYVDFERDLGKQQPGGRGRLDATLLSHLNSTFSELSSPLHFK